ncbi:hypothetical protein M404DRAFT_256942 [Pisolithus tinctorius Marx 270]|uniref:Uncharacterized protein n=1 Tax=Pisolithus tinctorius Marx 270 TaxID=870435 RepID=A0A0C3IGF8_PISTI|nr:hypothetical protein M404DRAFT_256942 [Pisolithus tinctorius Marx 270]
MQICFSGTKFCSQLVSIQTLQPIRQKLQPRGFRGATHIYLGWDQLPASRHQYYNHRSRRNRSSNTETSKAQCALKVIKELKLSTFDCQGPVQWKVRELTSTIRGMVIRVRWKERLTRVHFKSRWIRAPSCGIFGTTPCNFT